MDNFLRMFLTEHFQVIVRKETEWTEDSRKQGQLSFRHLAVF